MDIQSVSFGKIRIDGKSYTSDLILYPDGEIDSNWWRKQGHGLVEEDIEKLIESGPEVLIVGTGISGLMQPSEALKTKLQELNIETRFLPTPEAVESFQKMGTQKRVGACFHLTC